MDGRTSIWLGLAALALSSAGCITTQQSSDGSGQNIPPSAIKKAEYARRDPKPSTEVKMGESKELDADSAEGKKQPEIQARLRDEARLAYQHAIKLDPNYVDAYRHLGMLYAKMGDFERSIDTFKKVMAKNPKDPNLWYDLGQVHNRRKDFHSSVQCFNKALEYSPEDRAVLKSLGFTLAWQGQVDQGFVYLQRAQGPAMAHYNLARMALQRDPDDRLGQAHLYLQKALQENAQLAEARELLASLDLPAATAQR